MEEVKERKKEGNKERGKEEKKEKKGRKERKEKRGMVGLVTGGGRRRPEVAREGRLKPPAQAILWGASVVQKEKLEFWKWYFGERSYSSLERTLRGKEDGVIVGGQDSVGGGGNGGEGNGEDGLF